MKLRVRSAYLGAHFAMVGPALVAAFLMDNLVPTVIWLATAAIIVGFAKED